MRPRSLNQLIQRRSGALTPTSGLIWLAKRSYQRAVTRRSRKLKVRRDLDEGRGL